MELCFTIIHSPYTKIRIRIESNFSILDFKNLILGKYNLQQKYLDKMNCQNKNLDDLFLEYSKNLSLIPFSFPDFIQFDDMIKIYGMPYVTSDYNICSKFESANLKLSQNSTILSEFTDEYGKYQFFVINGYIYERMSQIIHKTMIKGLSEAQFTFFSYSDNLRQKIFKKKVKILQFEILRFNEDSSITIKLIKREKLNYCIGPDIAQKYYRLLDNGKVSLYKETENMKHHLSNEICETINEISCNYKFLNECSQCHKKNAFFIGDSECFKCKNFS